MDFLGIGSLELVIIFLVAFLVLGPRRFTEMARTAGRFIHNLKKMGSQLTADIWNLEEPPHQKSQKKKEG